MTTTKTIQEDKLLMAARLLDEEKLDALVRFVNKLALSKNQAEPTIDDKENFKAFLDDVRHKAAERGLTSEILDDILDEDE